MSNNKECSWWIEWLQYSALPNSRSDELITVCGMNNLCSFDGRISLDSVHIKVALYAETKLPRFIKAYRVRKGTITNSRVITPMIGLV